MWHETGHREEVTCIVQAPQPGTFAVGYTDGSIRLWNASSGSVSTTFNGHKKSITALAFDPSGTRLASGSQDTDIILWDVVGEAGLHRCVSFRLVFRPHFYKKIVFEGTVIKLQLFSFFRWQRTNLRHRQPLPPDFFLRRRRILS